MLALNRSRVDRDYSLINILMPWPLSFLYEVCIQSVYIKDYTKIRDVVFKGNAPSIQCRLRKNSGLNLVSVNFKVPELTPGPYWLETAWHLSDNIVTYFFNNDSYRCIIQKEGWMNICYFLRHYFYWNCTISGTGRNVVAPVYVVGVDISP